MPKPLVMFVIGAVAGAGIGAAAVLGIQPGMGAGHDRANMAADGPDSPDDPPGPALPGYGEKDPLRLEEGDDAPGLAVVISPDAAEGWNLRLLADNFRFAPAHVNGSHKRGEGHAHLYAGEQRLARLYGPWAHIQALPEGARTITVTLNANDHRPLMIGERPVAVTIEVPGR